MNGNQTCFIRFWQKYYMNDKIKLRELTDKDIPLFKKWLYMNHIAQWYHDPLDWIDEVEKRNSEYIWLNHFIVEFDEKPIGFCQYYEYCNSGEVWHGNIQINGAYSIDYMIGVISYLKRGIGKAIINQLVDKVKSHENAKCIIVQPESENKPSCNTLLSCGFYFDEENECN